MRDDKMRYRSENAAMESSTAVRDAEKTGADLLVVYSRASADLRNEALPLDDRLRAFWTLRFVEFKGYRSPLVEIERDWDTLDYLHGVVMAGVADGSIASQFGSTLATALRAAGFSRRERYA